MSESQEPVTKEMWYQGQKFQADNLKSLADSVQHLADKVDTIHNHLTSQDSTLAGIDNKVELKILEQAKQERSQSDKIYAMKLVEKVLFGILAVFGTGTIAYLASLLFKK